MMEREEPLSVAQALDRKQKQKYQRAAPTATAAAASAAAAAPSSASAAMTAPSGASGAERAAVEAAVRRAQATASQRALFWERVPGGFLNVAVNHFEKVAPMLPQGGACVAVLVWRWKRECPAYSFSGYDRLNDL